MLIFQVISANKTALGNRCLSGRCVRAWRSSNCRNTRIYELALQFVRQFGATNVQTNEIITSDRRKTLHKGIEIAKGVRAPNTHSNTPKDTHPLANWRGQEPTALASQHRGWMSRSQEVLNKFNTSYIRQMTGHKWGGKSVLMISRVGGPNKCCVFSTGFVFQLDLCLHCLNLRRS